MRVPCQVCGVDRGRRTRKPAHSQRGLVRRPVDVDVNLHEAQGKDASGLRVAGGGAQCPMPEAEGADVKAVPETA